MSFINEMEETLNEEFNVSVTENGALGHKTTGKELLDINFSVSSMRNMEEQQIVHRFTKAFYENKLLAVKWLFYARDAREGVGERRLFRVCMKYLATHHKDIARAVLVLVPEYGRFDDWLCLFDTDLADDVVALMKAQLEEDKKNMAEGKSISLLAKWLPSVNASSEETKILGKLICKALDMRQSDYRKMLSQMRAYIDVVEVKMSDKRWGDIDYSAVPSRANLVYNSAFLRNDETRRRAFLEAVKKGEETIHAGVLFPHDIVRKYYKNLEHGKAIYRGNLKEEEDDTLEELWKALPDFVQGQEKTLCIVDGSGSMTAPVGGTTITALDVAKALGIYFAERCTGEFKDKYITFSMNPKLVDLTNGDSLRQKLEISDMYFEAANTNIEKVFDLILETAVKNEMSQNDMPKNLVIMSDMEFDSCVCYSTGINSRWGYEICKRPDEKLFTTFANRFKEKGYKLPRLVFWNICGRTGTIPVIKNELGVALVSGFSPAIAKMVLSNMTDPFDCLLEQLNDTRYDAVEEVLKNLL